MEQGVAAASINIDTFLAYQRAHFPSPANLKTENENGVGGMYSMPAYQVPYPLHNNGSFPALPKPDPDLGNHQNFQGFNTDADAKAAAKYADVTAAKLLEIPPHTLTFYRKETGYPAEKMQFKYLG